MINKILVPIYYWDTSVFIHLLQKESASSDAEMQKGAGQIWDSAQDGSCKIIASTIALVEIGGNHTKHDEKQYKDFLRCCEDGIVSFIALNKQIAEKASEVRFHSWSTGKILKAVDSIHLATAIAYESIQTLYCSDGDLLKLYADEINKIAGRKLEVKKPIPSKLL